MSKFHYRLGHTWQLISDDDQRSGRTLILRFKTCQLRDVRVEGSASWGMCQLREVSVAGSASSREVPVRGKFQFGDVPEFLRHLFSESLRGQAFIEGEFFLILWYSGYIKLEKNRMGVKFFESIPNWHFLQIFLCYWEFESPKFRSTLIVCLCLTKLIEHIDQASQIWELHSTDTIKI